MYLAGDVVASWSLTQEVAGSNPLTVMTNIFNNVNSTNSMKHVSGKLKCPFFRVRVYAASDPAAG